VRERIELIDERHTLQEVNFSYMNKAFPNETRSGIVLSRGVETINTVPMGFEADIPSMHQPVDPSTKHSRNHCNLDIFIQLESMVLGS
jgi:hypothetical protein